MNPAISALVCALGFSVLAPQVSAAPAQVIIIRHGEKPANGNELNKKGFKRAAALVQVFANNLGLLAYGPPAAIYAMKQDGPSGSVRPIQTVTPLAKSLGLKVHHDLLRDEEEALAADIMNNPAYDGKMVLISWEHKVIPLIAEAFGCTTSPEKWDGGDVFDRAWVLTFSGDRVTSFADLPEHALPGDSD